MTGRDTVWTQDIIADIVAALDRSPEEVGETPALLASLGAERRIGVALSDDDLSHVPSFGRA